jgi:hypothetical protein
MYGTHAKEKEIIPILMSKCSSSTVNKVSQDCHWGKGYQNAECSLKRNWVIIMLALNIIDTLHIRPG